MTGYISSATRSANNAVAKEKGRELRNAMSDADFGTGCKVYTTDKRSKDEHRDEIERAMAEFLAKKAVKVIKAEPVKKGASVNVKGGKGKVASTSATVLKNIDNYADELDTLRSDFYANNSSELENLRSAHRAKNGS